MYYFVLQSLRKALPSTTSYYKACTKNSSQYYFVVQGLHKALPSTSLYYEACAKYHPVLLCTTKLAQSTSQYHFVLQSLHQKLFPVLPCTTKLAQSTSEYYFVVQSLRKDFPVLLCTAKLAQATSQYYFVLQDCLHKALPSTSLYYEACAKYHPVLLCTTKLAQSTSQYYFVLQSLHKKYFPVLLCTTRSFYTEKRFGTYWQQKLQLHTRIPAPKGKNRLWSTFEKDVFKENHQRQNEEKMLTNHYRSLDEATPIRFTMPSCKRQKYYACSRGTKQPWRSPTAQTRYPSSPAAATLNRKTQGFVLRLSPQAITMPFAASRGKPACIYAYDNTRWQQSCSHSNAICNHRFKKRKELRTHEQHWTTRYAEHQGRTDSTMKRLQPQPPHTQGTFQCRLQPLHTEKHMVSCSGFLPNTSPMQHSCSHYNAFCSIANRVANLHVSTHMTTQDDNNHAAIQMRFATTGSRNAKNYAHMNNIEQPHVAEHQGRTDSTMKRSQPQPPHTHTRYLSVLRAAT